MTDPAMHGAVCFYAASCYPVFDDIGYDRAKSAAEVAGNWTLECAPYRDKNGKFPEKELPEFGKRSIIFAIAVQSAFLVWTQRKAGYELPRNTFLDAADDGYKMHYGMPTLTI